MTLYDSPSTTFGNIKDQKSFFLTAPILAAGSTLIVESTSGLEYLVYLRINSEILRVESVDSETQATVTRGLLGTSAADHASGDVAYEVIVSAYIEKIKDVAEKAQRFHGKVGLASALPANPVAGQLYFSSDTKKVWVCSVAGQWELFGGVVAHSELGDTDDHPQYLSASRRDFWHNSISGSHILDGDTHDHTNGEGIGRFANGLLSAIPVSPVLGRTYFANDTEELHIANASATWIKITGAPTGAVMMFLQSGIALFGGACPPGWSRLTSMDGKFPRGAGSGITSPLVTGGTELHSHVYSQVPQHSHTIAAEVLTSSSSGLHAHSWPLSTLSSGTGLATTPGTAGGEYSSNSNGDHSHTATLGAATSGDAKRASDGGSGSASASTGNGSHVPEFQEVIFCKKD